MTFTWYTFLGESDYVGGPVSVTFGTSANDNQCREITLIIDNERENREDFFVDLNLTDMGGIRRGVPSRTVVAIEGTKFPFLPLTDTGIPALPATLMPDLTDISMRENYMNEAHLRLHISDLNCQSHMVYSAKR